MQNHVENSRPRALGAPADSLPPPMRLVPTQRGFEVGTFSLAPVWQRDVGRRLVLSDTLLVLVVTFGVQLLWLGPHWGYQVANGTRSLVHGPTYTVLSVLVSLGWMAALALTGSRSHRVLGAGLEEYRRVLTAGAWIFGLVAVVAFSMQYNVARGYVAIVFPLGVVVLCGERWLWRQWLNTRREDGAMVSRVLVVGTQAGAAPLARHIGRFRTSGLKVVGIVRTSGAVDDEAPREILAEALSRHANAVVVTTSAHLEPHQLRSLRWSLEELGADLIVAPALTGLAGRRMHTRPIEGLPLLHVDGARYDGTMRVIKGVFDRGFAAAAVLALSPLLITIAIAVRLTSSGPAFFRQERVGLHGRTFFIWKFRSMTDGADEELMHLLRTQGTHEQPLFKPAEDARVTPLGRFLRTWSLDELPQLFNVLLGDMSLVGPRPQRPAEVALYDDAAMRRLRVKPGLTGLWQVSGRSDLPWERAVELDLYYVENWSFAFDILLIWRTFAVVARGSGAY